MSDPPRRRRSTPPRRSEPSSLLPTIALGIGVVVAGLGIGAFLSAIQHKDNDNATATSAPRGAPIVTPVAQPTHGPVALATLVAHPTSTPTPTPSPLPTATAVATATVAATATPRTSATPRATETPAVPATRPPTPVAISVMTAVRVATERPAATSQQTPAARVVPTPPPLATPRPTAAPVAMATAVAAVRATPLTFGGIAQNTVRRYLADLIAGNENAAYGELGKAPGDPGASLSEEAFIDRGTRIVSIRTTSTDPGGATVEVELASGRGSYYATYHVLNGPNGPIIDQHDYIKV